MCLYRGAWRAKVAELWAIRIFFLLYCRRYCRRLLFISLLSPLIPSSYYPLYPPAEEINIDYENFYHYAKLPVSPDVLITPSDLRYFIKDILGCICMNPGRLTKGQVGGTYGRLYVQQQIHREERKSPCVAAQVIKI
uniref:DNA polymerase alpha subunit B n=1 Tax=Sphaerodactylus townsendi TaxID=933632 RepID=A0ACB8G934_9SAUR